MSIADILLLAVIAAAVIFALVRIKRRGGSCSCGSCGHCGGDCSACQDRGRKCDKKDDNMV